MARMSKKSGRKAKMTKKKKYGKPGFTRQVGFYGRYNGTPGWEKKWADTDIPNTAIPNAGTVFGSMNIVQQNGASNGRIGRKITVTNLAFNYYLSKGNATPFFAARVTVVLDRQANGAVATQGDVFQNAGDLTSYLNLANSNRFVILYDKYHDLNAQVVAVANTAIANTVTTIQYAPYVRHFKWSKRVNIPLEFSDGAVATIANVKSNNIFVIVQQDTAGAAGVTIDGVFRIRYSDS